MADDRPTGVRMRMRSLVLVVAAVAVLPGCLVLPPSVAPTAPPASSAPSSPAPSSPAPTSPAPSSPAPSSAPASPTPSPTATEEPAVAPDAAQCEASDGAMAGIIEATDPLEVAFPADGTPNDWATGDVVVADVQARYAAWVASTTDPVLLSGAPLLESEIGELATVVASRDEAQVSFLGVSGPVVGIVLAAATVVLPCDFD